MGPRSVWEGVFLQGGIIPLFGHLFIILTEILMFKITFITEADMDTKRYTYKNGIPFNSTQYGVQSPSYTLYKTWQNTIYKF